MTVGVYEENATSYSELVAAIDKSIIDYEALIKKIRTWLNKKLWRKSTQ